MTSSQPELLSDPLLRPPSPEPTKDPEKAAAAERVPGGWRVMPYVIGSEACEKLASIGLTANLTVYLVQQLGMKQLAAVKLGNIYGGTVNLMPLAGAFVSDAYWGRFRTLAAGSIASFLGMVFWTLTSLLPSSCSQVALQAGQCAGPDKVQLGFLFFSMGLLSLGSGGVRPCSLPFGIDQFDSTTEHGRRGMSSVFNWYYCTTTAAVLISATLVVYIQERISWPMGFGIPTCLMLISIFFLFVGTRLYVHVPPEGSVFSGIAQVFVASFRKRNIKLPSLDAVEKYETQLHDPPMTSERTMKLPLSQQFRFLNKAAIICDGELNADGSCSNSWRLCSVQQIEELKCLMQIAPIWASGIICVLAITQQCSFAILQSLKMDRHLGSSFQVPAASVVCLGLFVVVLIIPLYDCIFVPAARSITKLDTGITLLQRQGVGILISIVAMLVSALVETKRRESALSHGGVSPMSVMWLVPQIVLMGFAETLNGVGQTEFYNRQFPEHMRSLAGSLVSLSQAGASYLSGIMLSVIQSSTGGDGEESWLDSDINTGRLDNFFYLIAAMGVVNLLYFLLCAHFYRYKGM